MTRKVCIVINSRANYGRSKSILSAIKNQSDLELQLVVGASALLYRYGDVSKIIKNDGYKINAYVHSIIEGETPQTMAKSTGLSIIELSNHFENLKPDIVLTVADRFETIATAISASYMNIVLAHTQGGEKSGSIDESVRHSITKLAHIHFPATQKAKQNIIKMGENPKNVFLTGCPAMDLIPKKKSKINQVFFDKYGGVGPKIDVSKPYIVVLQHPVTTEYGSGFNQINQTLKAIKLFEKSDTQIVWLWPNVDAGSDDISKGLRMYREKYNPRNIHFFRNFSPEDYITLIANSKCIVGNSSSGLREGSYLGIPCVNIGNRQVERERGKNVIDVGYDYKSIFNAINLQINQHYKPSKLYGNGNAGKKIASFLSKVDLNINKKLFYK